MNTLKNKNSDVFYEVALKYLQLRWRQMTLAIHTVTCWNDSGSLKADIYTQFSWKSTQMIFGINSFKTNEQKRFLNLI